MDILQVAVLLLGITLGWLLIFAVRRYKVQWGAFASFMSVILGVTLVKFLYAADLLPYYAIGLFAGFFSNLVVRAVGTYAGGRLGESLLEISAYKPKAPQVGDDDLGTGQESQGKA